MGRLAGCERERTVHLMGNGCGVVRVAAGRLEDWDHLVEHQGSRVMGHWYHSVEHQGSRVMGYWYYSVEHQRSMVVGH